jgi:hypothetical protein
MSDTIIEMAGVTVCSNHVSRKHAVQIDLHTDLPLEVCHHFISPEHALSLLAQLEENRATLEQMVREHERSKNPSLMYTFVYEQRYVDADGWGPNYQHIEARTMEEAFKSFGRVIDVMSLTVRNVCYGLYSEMESEEQRVKDFYLKRKEEEKR